MHICITVSNQNAPPPKSTKYSNSTFSAQIQLKSKSQLELVP